MKNRVDKVILFDFSKLFFSFSPDFSRNLKKKILNPVVNPYKVWTNADGTRVLRKHSSNNGYDGCSAVNSVPNSNCIPGNRWAYIDNGFFETGGSPVNIWSKKGYTSGVYQCGKFKLLF